MSSVEISSALESEFVNELSRSLNWSNELKSAVLNDLPKIISDSNAVNLINSFVKSITGKNKEILKQIQVFNQSNKVTPDTFPLFCVIAAIPEMHKEYNRQKIPLHYANNILQDIQLWSNDFKRKHKRIGFDKLNWITNHLMLQIFQVGAFQYEPKTYNKPFRLLVNKRNSKTLCLAENNILCSELGLILDSSIKNGYHFSTIFKEDDFQFSGHAVSLKGYIQSKLESFSKNEWEQIAQPGDFYISFHIPEGAKLTLENLNSSFIESKEFFKNYFPEFHYHVYGTESWFLDDQIAEYMPDSNIANFQKCLQLLPIMNGNDEQFKERVFGDIKVDIDTVVPKTQLQKIGVQHIKEGKGWRKKGFILYKNDIPLRQKHSE